MQTDACCKSCVVACVGVLGLLSVSCAAIENREVKTVLSERESVVRPLDEIQVGGRKQTDGPVVFSASVSDRCTTITTTREGQVQEVTRSWVDFGLAGALTGASVGFLGWGLKCHNDPYSCPTGETVDGKTYNGGRTQGYVAIGFAVGAAIFATHAVYKHARAKDSLQERTYESSPHVCNRRELHSRDAELLLASGRRFSASDARRDGAFAFSGVLDWLVEHPDELERGFAEFEVQGHSYRVAWAEIVDVAEVKRRAVARREAIERQRRAEEEERERQRVLALRARLDQAWSSVDTNDPGQLQRYVKACEGLSVSHCGDAREKLHAWKQHMALATCGAAYLGESACNNLLKKEFGTVAAAMGCSALVQKASSGSVDGLELALTTAGALMEKSKSPGWRALGQAISVGLAYKCYHDQMRSIQP